MRSVLGSGLGERAMAADAAEVVPEMERELAALGRSSSERTVSINDLPARAGDGAKVEGGT